MRIGYFDCFAGASGDMIVACLFGVGLERAALVEELVKLGIKDLDIAVSDVDKKGIWAKSFTFSCGASPDYNTCKEIMQMIEDSDLSAWVKQRSGAAFDLLADAESMIHHIEKDTVHFHEVGAVDSVVDIVGSFIGLERLGVDRVLCSPITLGMGSVSCEHGTLPVPAPATLEIVKGLPVRSWEIAQELTTPTGAAILRAAAESFGSMPTMEITRVGYGAGSRDLKEIANIMRFVLGESKGYEFDQTTVIETNIDDMNPEFFSHIYGDLFSLGALDVWIGNILMKKGRPGFLLSVLCERQQVSRIVDFLLSETTTAGVRLKDVDRVKLERYTLDVDTKYGVVKAKIFRLDSKLRCVPEYEDCLRIAKAKGVPISEIIEETRNAFRRRQKASH